MAGQFKGVKTVIQEVQPLVHYTHFGTHRENIVAQTVSSYTAIKYDLSLISKIGVLIANTIQFEISMA